MIHQHSTPTQGLRMRAVARAIRQTFAPVAVGLAAIPPLALAQSDAPVLEEVVVTAQKRTESLQDVPVAVSAIAGDNLANTGFRDIADISAQVPSLIVTTNISPIQASFRLRRIGNEGNIPTFEPDTALIIDGAFRSRSGLGLGDLVDVKSVEVLKGPQGTLYGKNAGAGVVSVTTEQPGDEFEGMAELSYGSDNYRQFRGYVNSPLTDSISGRISYSNTRRDPLIDNLVGGDGDNLDGDALRGQLRYDISDALSARLIIGFLNRDMKPTLADTYYSPVQIDILQRAGYTVRTNDPSDRVVESDDNSDFTQKSKDAVLTVEYQGDGYTLTSITGAEDYIAKNRFGGAEELPLDLLEFYDVQEGRSFSQELRVASDTGDRLSWLVGAFYYDNRFTRGDRDRHEFILNEDIEEYGGAVAAVLLGLPGVVPLPALGVEGDAGDFYVRQDSRSLGLFTQESLRLTEDLEVAVGLRYSYEEKDGSIEQSNQLSPAGCVPPTNRNLICSVTPDGNNFDDSDSWSALTGNINLSYFINEESMVYALYSQGFKAGGYSLQFGGATPESRPFDQEDIYNYELGWKTEFWDRRARVNGSIFHTEYHDFQSASFISLAFAVNNAEKVTVDGIEIDSTWLLSQNLTANLNLAYIDAVYDEYSGGQCYFGRTPDNALGQCDLSGDNLPYAPKLTGNVALTWEQPLLSGDLYARLDYRYTDEANYSSELDPRHEEAGYRVGNFRLGWRNASYDVAAWVKNLEDETYYAQKLPANVSASVDAAVGSSEGSYQTFSGEPRTFGVTARMHF